MKKEVKDLRLRQTGKYLRTVLIILLFLGCVIAASFSTYAEGEGEAKTNTETYFSDVSELTNPGNLNFQGYDVIYAVDNSRSVWKQQDIRNQALRNISNLAVGSDIRIGVVYFADKIYGNALGLTSMKNQEDSQRVLNYLNMKEQNADNVDTNIGIALEKAVELFDSQDTSRKRIVVLFSDGINENLSGDQTYTEEADAKTKEQTLILKEMNIPIYCVYLQKGRNDEEYLKKIVNYFSEDESYETERFFKLKEDEISKLNHVFADVFYAMQNNMKYKQIKLDSSGRCTFYVPSLGIEELRIYLDGDIRNGSNLYPPVESECTTWTDGTARFLIYEEPISAGDWWIEVKSPNFDHVYGTIAYYPSLQARAELVRIVEDTDGASKRYQLTLRFYDKNAEEIAIDSAVGVAATVFLTEEGGEESSVELTMHVGDGIAKSDMFAMDGYGTCHYDVNLTYDNFIDLDYMIEGGIISKSAPKVFDITEGKFEGEKVEGGICFLLKESSLFDDPENEIVKIKNIIQLNPANTVTVKQENGYLEITAKNAGEVNFALQLIDESEMMAEVTVKGTVTDQGRIRNMQAGVKILFAVIVILAFCSIISKKKKKKILKNDLVEFEQLHAEFEKMYTSYEENEEFQKEKRDINLILNGDRECELTGLIDMASSLTKEQKKDFAVDQYLVEGFTDTVFERAEAIACEMADAKDSMGALAEKVESIKSNPKNIKAAGKMVRECCEQAEKELERLENGLEEVKTQNKKINTIISEMIKAAEVVDEMLSTKISCDLSVKNISELPNKRGRYSSRDIQKRTIQGYYKLDDVIIVGMGTLGEELGGETGIYVYGYEDATDIPGLKLRSIKEFQWKEVREFCDFKTGRQAILTKGTEYELKINMGHREITMVVIGR